MFVRFYADAAENPDDWAFSKVIDDKKLPPGLASLPNAHKYLKREELSVLDMEYMTKNLVTEGLHDPLSFSNPKQLECVNVSSSLSSYSLFYIILLQN